ncbi:MAG: hypothetical protein ACPL68_04295, partial [Candidatus Hydrothermia bacterium]
MIGWESLFLGTALLAQGGLSDTAGISDTLSAPYFHQNFSETFLRNTQGIRDSSAIRGDYVFLSKIYRQVAIDTFAIMPLSRYLAERVAYKRRDWLVDALLAQNKE